MKGKALDVTFFSEADKSMQPALLLPAEGGEARPLVVALHTWSYSIGDQADPYFARCAARNWHCIFPAFRGPNWTPQACGSDLVVSDLAGAVAYMKENYPVDDSRIFLVGGSGGGHASLLMAGRRPELWSAVSAWCPISDLAKWHDFSRLRGTGYDEHIRKACGGDPSADRSVFDEAMRRSPATYLGNAAGKTIVDIGTGIHDGHRGSVPVSHTLEAFNLLAAENDRISAEDIGYMVKNEAVPEHLRFDGEDPAYGKYKVLFRRVSGMARVTIFEGGHDLLGGPAFGFFDRQCRGQSPVWYSGEKADFQEAALGK